MRVVELTCDQCDERLDQNYYAHYLTLREARQPVLLGPNEVILAIAITEPDVDRHFCNRACLIAFVS